MGKSHNITISFQSLSLFHSKKKGHTSDHRRMFLNFFHSRFNLNSLSMLTLFKKLHIVREIVRGEEYKWVIEDASAMSWAPWSKSSSKVKINQSYYRFASRSTAWVVRNLLFRAGTMGFCYICSGIGRKRALAYQTFWCPDYMLDVWIYNACVGYRCGCTSPGIVDTGTCPGSGRDNGFVCVLLFYHTICICAGCSRLAICQTLAACARLLNLQKPKHTTV